MSIRWSYFNNTAFYKYSAIVQLWISEIQGIFRLKDFSIKITRWYYYKITIAQAE
jgi:hypothetical protein